MAHALRFNRSLRSLHLDHCSRLGDIGAQSLAAALQPRASTSIDALLLLNQNQQHSGNLGGQLQLSASQRQFNDSAPGPRPSSSSTRQPEPIILPVNETLTGLSLEGNTLVTEKGQASLMRMLSDNVFLTVCRGP